MTKIPEEFTQRLRSRGLFVADPMPSEHVFPDGVFVGKPTTLVGNFIPGKYKTF